jgi:acyl-CoA synthetase (AMP-forming)/AMP-acid ligase II
VTFVDILRERAARQPSRWAYSFLADGQHEEARLTYGALDLRVRSVAAELQRLRLQGERAVLLFEPGLDYVVALFACFYAGVTAVPTYPPHRARPRRGLETLRAVMRSAQPRAVLTSTGLLRARALLAEGLGNGRETRWIPTDAVGDDAAARWRDTVPGPEDIAVLQHTSGSTAAPKGVMVSHDNLVSNSQMIQMAWRHADTSVCVSWLPPYHDMGLVGGILQPLFGGFPTVLLSPLHVVQQPLRWLQAISRFRGTGSGAPNFMYDLCVQRVPREQRLSLDLSSWQVAFNGAEPVQADTLEAFSEAFAPSGFRRSAFFPCYGLAEATLFVTGGHLAGEPSRMPISCGTAWMDERVVIVDPDRTVARPTGEVGEIWVSGRNVAKGYWGQPEASRESFGAHRSDTGEGPYLRTGDLGAVDGQGRLSVTGRLKDLIILRGRKHHPEDIERTIQSSHSAFRAGRTAAFAVDGHGEERVVVIQEAARQSARNERDQLIRRARQAAVEEHDIDLADIVLVLAGSLPRTHSGKVRRHACKTAYHMGMLTRI